MRKVLTKRLDESGILGLNSARRKLRPMGGQLNSTLPHGASHAVGSGKPNWASRWSRRLIQRGIQMQTNELTSHHRRRRMPPRKAAVALAGVAAISALMLGASAASAATE